MAIDKDITEGLPYNLGNSVISTAFSSSDINYDIAISGIPFLLASSDATPYRRDTAAYRKQQIDQSNEPGEQTLTGWWLRSQASFHYGCGIKYFDPATADDSGKYRFADSRGVDVWTKGQVSLLKSSIQGHNVTTALQSNGRTAQHIRSIKWGTTNGALMLDGYDVDKIDNTGTATHFIDYISGVGVYPVYAICDDGTYAYWVTNKTSGATTKLTMFKKPLTGSAASTADEVQMMQDSAIISNAVMEYVKDRIVLCADNKVYEIPSSSTGPSFPTPIYTHPSSTYVYTSITASGPAIYVAGYNGIQSTINKFTLSTSGSMPTLTSAVVAAELPVGEIVHKIFYYLGYMMIGTSKGVRAAEVQSDGSIVYGPLIVETTQPCYDFAARDKYIWCATSVAGEAGLIRIDLGAEIETLRFAWAYDIYYPGATGHDTTGVTFIGDTTQLAYVTAYNTSNGYVYVSSLTSLMSSGYLTTGRIRYSTLENKVFKSIKSLVDNSGGGFSVSTISSAGNEYSIGSFAEDDLVEELGITKPIGAQEYISFKFTLNCSLTVTTTGAVFTGHQIKSLPSIRKQRLIQFAVSCYDHHTDTFGNQIGYEGMAYDKLSALEALEDESDTVRIEDFRTGESFLGLIEEVQFVNPTPTDKVNSGFGGIILITVRKL